MLRRRLGLGLLLAGLAAAVALAANPNFESPTGDTRLDAPDDPEYDRSEPDDASGDFVSGNSVFEEQYELFGFAPFTTSDTALYLDPDSPFPLLTPQVSGVYADDAWQLSIGRPDVAIAILDTGIRWNRGELRNKVRLNCGELPAPQDAGGNTTAGSSPGCRDAALEYDLDGSGGFEPDDYANDARVNQSSSPRGIGGAVDGLDLILAFSDAADDDSNGFVDDIAGWDFFDDDNDPDDVSSYSSSGNHGSGRAEEAGGETNDDAGGAALCPRCRILPMRVWDTFVVEMNNFGQAVGYAADNGARVVEAAVGGLQNARFAREVHQYAYERGVALMEVSSDLNTADHNYPTNYNNTIFVSGVVADTHGLGIEGNEFFPPVPNFGFEFPVATWFRDSGLTQYGGHHHINMVGDTGSHATGQAAGAAGLLISHARTVLDRWLTANEVKQLLTLTAEDVLPGNTAGIGAPDPAQPGWDQHFGYGRVNLGAALQRVTDGPIPPEATLESPAWFQVLDPDPNGDDILDASFPVFATFDIDAGGSLDWTLEVGPGIEPAESPVSQYTVLASSSAAAPFGHGAGLTRPGALLATLAAVDIAAAAFPTKLAPGDFSLPPLAVGPPIQGAANVPSNEFAFTLRLRVTDPSDGSNVAEDRKTLFLHHDPTLRPGFPIFSNVGGESAIKLADIDGDNRLDVVVADSAGELAVYDQSGVPLASFNGGAPVLAPAAPNAIPHAGAPVFSELAMPRLTFGTPAIGDLDRDGVPEIVSPAGEEVFVFQADGSLRPGSPVGVNAAFSAPALRSGSNHLKTGILAAPALGDLDRDGHLEIVAAALDQRVYAWNDDGTPLAGWPVFLKDPANPPGSDPGAEIVVTPTLADIDGDDWLDVVVSTNEVYDGTFDPNEDFEEIGTLLSDPVGNLTGFPNQLAGLALDDFFGFGAPPAQGVPALGGEGRIYAIRAQGTAYDLDPADDGGGSVDVDAFLPGWPVPLPSLLPDALPLVGPGQMAAAADLDGDPATKEVVVSAAAGNIQVLRHDGLPIRRMSLSNFGIASDTVDPTALIDLFAYPSIADLDLDGDPDIIKAGLSVNGALNLVLVGQNLPFNHLLAAWDGNSGDFLPAFPKAIDDFQLLAHPVVADVGSPIAGVADGLPDVIVGTGLYLLHAYNAAGLEPAGFPKLTGGWLQAPPSLGDVDGDGLLEIAANTREGNVYLWDSDGPACGNNDQWWTFHHDEWNSGDYGRDTRAPDRILSLTGARPLPTSVALSWTAPGDDGPCGTAESYELRISSSPITPANFAAATRRPAPVPTAAGTPQAAPVSVPPGTVYLGLRAVDEAGNPGRLQVLEIN